MKRKPSFLLFPVAVLLLYPGSICAQDAVIVDPEHYKIEMENDFVRVLRITYGPGEQSVAHEHPKGIAVFLTDYSVQFTLPSGEEIPVTGKKGQVRWADAEKHLPSNTGPQPLEVIQVELKEGGPSNFDMEAAKAAIEKRNTQFMELYQQKDAVGLANLYTSDGQFMGANIPSSKGKEAILETFQNYMNSGIAKIELQNIEMWGDENMLITEDAWQIFLEDGTEIDRGKAMVFWKKEEGTWKMFRDIINSDLALQTSKE